MALIADISKWQGNIDWSQAAKELSFCILRASNSKTEDTMFRTYVGKCKEYNVPFHVYHYMKAATKEQAIEEACFFYKVASPHSPLFYVVDVEDAIIPSAKARELVGLFIDELKRLGANKIGIYVSHNKYAAYNLAIEDADYIWIPRYGSNDGTINSSKKPNYPCDLWQYTSAGRINGISGNVDLNVLNSNKPLSFYIETTAHLEISNKEESNMSYDPRKVIDIALGEVGYLEKKTNSQLDSKTANAGSNNYTKYARDLNALNFYNGNKQGVAWCDQFVDWCIVQAFGKDVALEITFQPKKASSNCGAGCKYSRQYYEQNGYLFKTPEIGDQIFFYNSSKSVSHTGLVYDVDKTYVYTVEGNTSGASGVVANGGGVCKKKYKLNYNRIAGYGRPNYGMKYTASFKVLSKGDEGLAVEQLQTNLMKLGYTLPKYGADGDFGSETEGALKQFQKTVGLTANGIYDERTNAKIDELLNNNVDTKEESSTTDADKSTPATNTVGAITTNPGTWNLRTGPGTNYSSAAMISGGLKLKVIELNGWTPVEYEGKLLWVGPSAIKK